MEDHIHDNLKNKSRKKILPAAGKNFGKTKIFPKNKKSAEKQKTTLFLYN